MELMAKTAYICDACRRADKEGATHPGVRHRPGICDCACREADRG